MPQARSTHQPRKASNKTNPPETANATPSHSETKKPKPAQMKEFASPLAQEDYVRLLVSANEKLVADAAKARDLAGEANDPESQDLMIARITLHQKTIWMLRSFLKS